MRGTCLALGIDVCIFRTIPLCVHVLTFEVEIFFFFFFSAHDMIKGQFLETGISINFVILAS